MSEEGDQYAEHTCETQLAAHGDGGTLGSIQRTTFDKM